MLSTLLKWKVAIQLVCVEEDLYEKFVNIQEKLFQMSKLPAGVPPHCRIILCCQKSRDV